MPSTVDIQISNSALYKLVNADVHTLLLSAQKNHENRAHFLRKVNTILYSYDQIDQYWIRLGFDRKLQIGATVQTPLFVFQGKGTETFIVSNDGKIIAKNPPPRQTVGLMHLSAPDLKLNWKPKVTFLKNHGSPVVNPRVLTNYTNEVNFSWLILQTKSLYSQIQDQHLPLFIQNVSWNKVSGFQVDLTDAPRSTHPETSAPAASYALSVRLGKEKLPSRINQLKIMLSDLSRKNIVPSEIDLDYSDKASFKTGTMSQNFATNTGFH